MRPDFNTIYNRYYAEHEPLDAFLFHCEEQLRGVSIADKTILEVGCGNGAFSLYLALCGKAKEVCALDAAEGRGMDRAAFQTFEKITQENTIANLTTVKSSLYEYEMPENSFDLIIANSALHHAIRPFGYLFKNEKARHASIATFKLLHSLLKDGGMVVLREMSRINFWRFMPYKWKMSHIDWKSHTTLNGWSYIMQKGGFEDVHHAFLTPFSLRKWPSFFIRNFYANFFFSSSFYLYGTCRKHNKPT